MKPRDPHLSRHPLHQHPLIYVGIFLVLAVGALTIIVLGNQPQDTGSGGTPGPDLGFQCTQGVPEGFALSDVEGKTLAEVEAWAAGKDWTVRVVAEDGEPKAMTMDYRPDRVNVQLEAGVVTRYCGNS